jgi:transposase InsO family protein
LPWYRDQRIPCLRILTDRGTEYCGKIEHHAYQLFLSIEDIEHSKTKAYSPQTNGICERFHKTIKKEVYDTAFRKKVYKFSDYWRVKTENSLALSILYEPVWKVFGGSL